MTESICILNDYIYFSIIILKKKAQFVRNHNETHFSYAFLGFALAVPSSANMEDHVGHARILLSDDTKIAVRSLEKENEEEK